MANAYRGEIALRLAGQDYVLRPTFAHLAELEDVFGLPLVEIARLFIEGRATLKMKAQVLRVLTQGQGELREEEFNAALVGAAYKPTALALADFFAAAFGIEVESGE